MLLAGAAYFVTVFAAGFLLGTLRILWVAPYAGEIFAVALEVPIMLVVAWFACGWSLSKLNVSQKILDRIVMGAFALLLLLMAEALLSLSLGGLSFQQHLHSYTQTGPRIGLAAQLLYAGFPVIRAQTRKDDFSA